MFPCPRCNASMSLTQSENRTQPVACPGCGERFIFEFFPALTTPAVTATARSVLEGGESSCFYHADKVAVQSCGYCGRFLCGLCEVAIDGQHLCPMCLAKGKNAISPSSALNNHTLHDSIALTSALFTLLLWPFAVVTGPATFYLILKNYRKDMGILPRNRWRFWLAGFLALAGMGLSGSMMTAMIMMD